MKTATAAFEVTRRMDELRRGLVAAVAETTNSVSAVLRLGMCLSDLQHSLVMYAAGRVPAAFAADPKAGLALSKQYEQRHQRVMKMIASWNKLLA